MVGDQKPKALQGLKKEQLPVLNSDIIDVSNPVDIQLDPPYSYLNYALKPDLKEQEHYVLLDKNCWSVFQGYDRYELKRKMQVTRDGKKVEVYFRRVHLNGT